MQVGQAPVVLNRSDAGGKLVLGVDDAPDSLFLLGAIVKSGGYAFLAAASGPECLSITLRAFPRLILLDVEMPGMDGFETCRRLRSNPELSAVPIAFLTARKTAEDVQTGVAAGGNDFIVKPFDRDRLLARIAHWVNRRVGAGFRA